MTDDVELEREYRRWLRWYPTSFRREHEEEMLGVLMESAREGQRQPDLIDCFDLLRSALWMRLRPSVPRSDRSVFNAVKLMYYGAVVELVAAITIAATINDVALNVATRNRGLSPEKWYPLVAGQIEPKAIVAGIAVGFWLWMAWSIGRGHRRAPRIAFALFFALNTWSLLDGLAQGSAVYAQADLAIGSVLWLLELATIALIFQLKVAVPLPAASSSATGG